MSKDSVDKKLLLKGSEVCRLLGLGATAGYRYLAFLKKEGVLTPVQLPGWKTPRWNKGEVIELTKNKDAKRWTTETFEVHQATQ
jgi:transposase